MTRITFSLPEYQYRALQELAKAKGISYSRLIRGIVREMIEKSKHNIF